MKYQQQVMTPLKNKQSTHLGFAETGSLRWPRFLLMHRQQSHCGVRNLVHFASTGRKAQNVHMFDNIMTDFQ